MPSNSSSLPGHARAVIIGAGVAGCSVAYHLTQMGWKDIVVLDQGPLPDTGGSSSHAPAFLFQINPNKFYAQAAKYTIELFGSLKLDGQPVLHQVGGLEVAWTPERLEELKRKVGFAKSWGLHAEVISPKETLELFPLLSDKILGAMFNPTDSLVKGVRADEAMTIEAEARGARFFGQVQVTDIEVKNGRVEAVVTDKGRIVTENVVSAAGIWGPMIGRMVGVTFPMYPMQHPLVKIGPLAELKGHTKEITRPAVRHQDKSMYAREYFEYIEVGTYRNEPLLVEPEDIVPYEMARVTPAIMPFNLDIFAGSLIDVEDLIPSVADGQLFEPINGMFSFTTDGMPILGEAPQVKGFWAAQAVWVAHAGGIGRTLAEWMVEGATSIDAHEADIARFHPYANNRTYVKERSAQQYREVYGIIHPLLQSEQERGLRTSPFNVRQKELGANFFESAGWERPFWYEANEKLLDSYEVPPRSGWEAINWSPIIGAEHKAVRERVGMFDQTPFAVFEVAGPKALEFLQSVTSNNMDRPPGKIIYTSLLDHRGRIKCDLTITRLAEDRYIVVTGGGFALHDLAWIRSHLSENGSVTVTDISSSMSCIGLWGPRARDVLSAVTDADVSNEAFPYVTAQEISIAGAPCLALRISYVGELGWEINCPTEYGLRLWDALWEAGQPHGIIAAGGGAFDSLRLEKGYRLWGADIHTEFNPYEAGIGFAVRLKKGDFHGRDALVKAKEEGLKQKLCAMTFDDPKAVVVGNEPILDGDTPIGYVTSANYGYSIGRGIVYGYLPIEYAEEGTKVDVEYFGKPYRATVSKEPLYDPEMIKLKS